ncbi:MAG TPA: UDP-N-acetylmuramate:L-alanyl-gamma-D-glutamyl-meso-diaminopimelate ligase, partial [Longimicrobiales bacterium]|nr:UDP-N-acetylmuramate:L-alanyl-gamma-D-glutamyl-meso-diaminopimelate ligase [Longimicrobiales bacterium]
VIFHAMHYHLIGIAGTAMGSLAGLLREAGHTVTGSDAGVYPPMSTMLRELGIAYAESYDPANLEPAPDVVVVGNAISRGNPELEAVLDRRLHYTSAASAVKEQFLRDRKVLAVAGTHGKTTTTSILAWLLESAGLRPSFLIGGVAENFGTSFRLTDSEYFVIEADEYDTAYFDKGPKMWHYLPYVALVLNLEFDHADIFRDDVAYRFAFERFINLVPRNGTLVAGWEGETLRAMALKSFAPVESFGLPDGGEYGDDHPRWTADGIAYGAEGTIFNVHHAGKCLGDVKTALSGAFNVRNCLAAIAAATAVGASWDGVREGLATFRSVRRRMEVRGEVGGVAVIDDFAHHPTAVRETIEATRQRFPDRRVVALFEPRSYTAQRLEFQEPYRAAFGGADRVILAGLFHPERYDETTGMDPERLTADLRADGVDARYIPDVDEIVATLVPDLAPGDVVLVMSNGSFGGIHERLLGALEGAATR